MRRLRTEALASFLTIIAVFHLATCLTKTLTVLQLLLRLSSGPLGVSNHIRDKVKILWKHRKTKDEDLPKMWKRIQGLVGGVV